MANQDTLNKPVCDADICEVESELCEDPDADEPDYEPELYNPCQDNAELCEPENEKRGLQKRAPGINLPGARLGTKHFAQLAVGVVPRITIPFAPYPSQYGDLFLEKGKSLVTLPWEGGIKMADDICLGVAITYVAAADMKRKVDDYTGKVRGAIWNTEHHSEVSIRYAVPRYHGSHSLDING
jgi:chitinase